MTLSIILFLMTLVALGVVIGPLVHPTKINSALSGNELEIYKNQLEDIDRDLKLGLITATEADVARVEIHRRVISSSATQQSLHVSSRRQTLLAVIIIGLCIPTTSLIIYLQMGRPDLAFESIHSNRSSIAADQNIKNLEKKAAEIATILEKDPGQTKLWSQLGAILLGIGQFERAAIAYLQAHNLAPKTPGYISRAGEALTFAAGGTVTPRAERLFTNTMKRNPHDFRAQYYIGLANFQRGNYQTALKVWVLLEAKLENKTQRRQLIQKRINKLAQQLNMNMKKLAKLRDQARQNTNVNQ